MASAEKFENRPLGPTISTRALKQLPATADFLWFWIVSNPIRVVDSTCIDKVQVGRTVNLLTQIRRPVETGACVASVHPPWCESET